MPPPIDFGREEVDRLGNRLVDRFVEAADVLQGLRRVREVVAPQAQHAGAQGTVFGDELADREPRGRAQERMRLRRGFRARLPIRSALGLGLLLRARLGGAQVLRDGLEDLLGMVAQRDVVHLGGRRHGGRELHPLGHDALHVALDEIREAERSGAHAPGYCTDCQPGGGGSAGSTASSFT